MGRHRLPVANVAWTADVAYAIGLIATDGCLSSDGRHLEFCSKDLENVEHLRRCLGLRNTISMKKRGRAPFLEYYRVQFGDVGFYRFLQTIGLHPRKSRTLEKVEAPRQYFSDFVRGLWDGDGCITSARHPASRHLQWRAHLSSGSLPFLVWLGQTIQERYGLMGDIHPTSRIHRLLYYKREGARLLRVMYKERDAVCLSRKRRVAERFMRDAAGVAELVQA